MSKETNLQHDIFYRKVFSKKKNLEDLLRNALPKEYLDKIDFESITLTKESFIGSKEKPLYSDMVVNTRMNGKETKISILIEHKAKKDRFTLLQMLKYLALLWDEEKNNNKELTLSWIALTRRQSF